MLENLSYYYALASYCVFQANDHLDAQYAQKHFALKDFSPNMQDPIVMPSRLNAKLVVKVGLLHTISFVNIILRFRIARPNFPNDPAPIIYRVFFLCWAKTTL